MKMGSISAIHELLRSARQAQPDLQNPNWPFSSSGDCGRQNVERRSLLMSRSCLPKFTVLMVAGAVFTAAALGREPVAAKPRPDGAGTAEISARVLRRHVEYLASPKLEGRGTPRGKQ